MRYLPDGKAIGCALAPDIRARESTRRHPTSMPGSVCPAISDTGWEACYLRPGAWPSGWNYPGATTICHATGWMTKCVRLSSGCNPAGKRGSLFCDPRWQNGSLFYNPFFPSPRPD
jgi:hypothetical protein